MGVLTQRRLPTALAAALTVTLASFLFSSAWAQSPDGAQPAVWKQKEFKFTYQGFTTKYSCDGLRGKVRDILLAYGARKDLQVNEWGCSGRGGVPDPFPGVAVKMSVLVPADAAKDAADEPAVATATLAAADG